MNIALISRKLTASPANENVPGSRISRAARRNAPSAARGSPLPALTRRTPIVAGPARVSDTPWLTAPKEFLIKEKEFTRLRDDLSRQRRELPWMAVEKPYTFDGPAGKETLADLFAGRSQLIVYHFMFGPGWKEGCPSCSFIADHFDGMTVHLAARDITLVAVSRGTLPELDAYQKRMGWHFKWVSSFGSDFNLDYHVSAGAE